MHPLHQQQSARRVTFVVAESGETIHVGDQVRLLPRASADAVDMFLRDQLGRVEAIEECIDGPMLLAVTLLDDPGRDLGIDGRPGHRFFFRPEEVTVEPGASRSQGADRPRILVAGIGNVFLGDDAFGVLVAQRLLAEPAPNGVRVADFGIRGMDLALALSSGLEAAILIDLVHRHGPPGEVCVMEPQIDESFPAEHAPDAALAPHALTPEHVLRLASRLGELPPQLYLVGCSPESLEPSAGPQLSAAVAAAVDPAAALVHKLLAGILQAETDQPAIPTKSRPHFPQP